MSESSALPPASVRRAATLALAVALGHTVFGAIVRISGSGMGCGDNWPKCYGYWFPPLERRDLIIEVTHRYLAIALFASIAWLVVAAWRSRAELQSRAGAHTWSGARIALALWFAPALFGAVTVFTGNPAWATVVHKLLAASLLAVLTFTTISAGGLGGTSIRGERGTGKAIGRARSVAIGALLVVLLGGLTAKLPGAAVACVGFPLCGEGSLGGAGQHVQLTHRLLAYLVVLDLITLPFIFRSRREAPTLVRAAWIGLTLGVLQVGWAAWMVTGGFPAAIRSVHQATGIMIFVTGFAMWCLARLTTPTSAAAT